MTLQNKKNKRGFGFRGVKVAGLAASFAMLGVSAQAVTYDIGAGAGAIGTGTNWNVNTSWNPSTGNPGSADDISITSTAGNKQINVNGAYTVNNFAFNATTDVMFVGSGGSNSITMADLTKAGSGTLTLASKFSGGPLVLTINNISVTAGTLNLGYDTGPSPTNSLLKGLNGLSVSGGTSVSSGANLNIYSAFSGGGSSTRILGVGSINGALSIGNNATGVTSVSSTFQFNGLSGANTGTITTGAAITPATLTTIMRFTQAAGTSATYAGSISQGTGSTISLQHAGGGIQEFSGATGYTGTTTISAGGTVVYSGASTVGGTGAGFITLSGGTVANGGSVIGVGNGNLTTWAASATSAANNINMLSAAGFAAYGADRTVTLTNGPLTWGSGGFLAAGAGPGTLVLGQTTSTHKLTFSNNIALGTTARTVLVNNGTGAVDGSLSGVISSGAGGGLVKDGDGTLEVTGNNIYTGATSVAKGTLLVNNTAGSGTGTGAVSVASGATLGGNGTISGLVTTASTTSVIAPGDVPAGTSVFTLSGGLDATAGATFNFGLGTSSDQLVLGGVFTDSAAAGGLIFNLVDSGGFAAVSGNTFILIDYASTPGLALSDLALGSQIAGYNATLGIDSLNNNVIVSFTAVPEPSTYALLGIGMASLWFLRRRSAKA